MERNLVLTSLAIAIFFGILLSFNFGSTPTTNVAPTPEIVYTHSTVTIGVKTFDALVSDTDKLREQGLSGRSGLATNQVMLFIFSKPGNLGFWMKDMKFSIDILWLDSQYHVVSFEKNIAPNTYPKVFFPTQASQYVIELSAGTLAKLSIKEGDAVTVSGGK
jgi:uncharacterized membrane protein (UPF0127 family)